jgi:hypothetical protein
MIRQGFDRVNEAGRTRQLGVAFDRGRVGPARMNAELLGVARPATRNDQRRIGLGGSTERSASHWAKNATASGLRSTALIT